MRRRWIALLAVVPVALAACTRTPAPPAPGALPALAADTGTLTVSGLSSGGYMATQFQVAFGTEVRGAAIIAAGPWNCARGVLQLALQDCLGDPASAPPVPLLLEALRASALLGVVDPTSSMADDRVWVFRGTRDTTVAAPVTAALVAQYRALLPPDQLQVVDTVPAGHGMPTLAGGGECAASGTPYLNACGYDAAGELLDFLYAAPAAVDGAPHGELLRFDQRPYDRRRMLADTGYLFVPDACRDGTGRCRLHVAFHGCEQGSTAVGEAFVRDAGYNGWAAAHRTVVLYPQVQASALVPFNPKGCWDWWGYSGPDYATRGGAQLAAVHAMVRRLMEVPPARPGAIQGR